MSLPRRTIIVGIAAAALAILAGCTRKSEPRTPPPSTPLPTETETSVTAMPTPSATTPTPSLADPVAPGVVNALIFGTDSRTKTSLNGNSDVLVLAHLSTDHTRLTLISIARDSYVPIGGGASNKINAAFPQGGTPLLVKTVSDLFDGLKIDITAQTNFNGFISMTRWLKGITVVNRRASRTKVISTGRELNFPAGKLTLTGTDGLIYARQRKELPLGDLDRAERHRALIIGMLQGLKALSKTPKTFDTIVDKLVGNAKVTGPITPAQVPAMRATLDKIDVNHITSLMVPIARFDMIRGMSVDIVNEPQMKALSEAVRSDTIDAYVAKYGTDYAPHG